MFNFEQTILNIPSKPGVYLMKDSLGNTIYVGKAKNLKNRVRQYFQKSIKHSPKIQNMVLFINSIEHIVTDTELEAFILECRLIKEIKPKYNSQMKNDKRYSYIKIDMKERFPKLSVAAEKTGKSALYFGPYTSLHLVENAVSFIKDCFPIRKCSSHLMKETSGCLNYHMGSCLGVCREGADIEEYRKCIENIIGLLEGKDSSAVTVLQCKMNKAVEMLEFEKAAKYRDELRGIRHILNKQALIKSSQRGRNIISMELMDGKKIKLFLIKGNKLLYTEVISTDAIEKRAMEEHIYELLFTYFCGTAENHVKGISQQEIDEAQIIYSYLKKNKNQIMSFWIPSTWFQKGNLRISNGISKISDKIFKIEI